MADTPQVGNHLVSPFDKRRRVSTQNHQAGIAELSALNKLAQFSHRKACKLCRQDAILFDRVDFNKYCSPDNYYEFGFAGIDVTYYRCLSCGFVFTEDFDTWPNEAFANFIYNEDYIKVDGEYEAERPRRVAADFARRFAGCQHARILDYGSGAGVFVELMREAGFSRIEAYDPFSNPRPPQGLFDIITCFEVIEHSTDPHGTLADISRYLREDGCIVFSQTVQPPNILSIRGSWWYLAPRNGHVSTYTEESLVELARQHGLYLHKGDTVYAFATRFPSSYAARALDQVGPRLTVLRALAPGAESLPAEQQKPPLSGAWHAAQQDELWRCRWTASPTLWWDAQWGEASLLQVRIPFVDEAEPGFAAACSLELRGTRRQVTLDRGEMAAEFDVKGVTSGPIVLHTPEPLTPNSASRPAARRETDLPGGPRGLAVLTSLLPMISENSEAAKKRAGVAAAGAAE